MRERERSLTALLAVAAFAVSACTGAAGVAQEADDDGAYPGLARTLCRATSTGDTQAAADAFAAAHAPLHELAADIAEVDRELAGRLHVAKQATETALRGEDADLAAARLDELHGVARESLIAVGVNPPACDGAGTP